MKRTVEGDLGMRSSAVSLLRCIVEDSNRIRALSSWKFTTLQAACYYRCSHPTYVPKTREECLIDQFLAQSATAIALERHAGKIRKNIRQIVQSTTSMEKIFEISKQSLVLVALSFIVNLLKNS